MAITAYSKKFKRELDVKQLLDLYQQLPEDINHSEFIRTDIECPCCGTTGGRIISEGRSTKTNGVVKQAHFAFKNDNGLDTHLVFCDYYTGDDRDKKPSDESVINLSKSGSATTEAIRKLVCTAIENDIFKQQDIRNMRSWFFEMRSTQDFKVEITKHHLNILSANYWIIQPPILVRGLPSITISSRPHRSKLTSLLFRENFFSVRSS